MAGAAWAVEKLYREREAVGQVGRALEVVEMPGANHFVRPFPFFRFGDVGAALMKIWHSPIGMNPRQ